MNITSLLIVLTTLVSLLYLLIIVSILQRRSLKEPSAGLLIDYIVCSWVWTLLHLILWLDGISFLSQQHLHRILLYVTLLLAIIFFHLTQIFLRLPNHSKIWWGVGLGWLVVSVVLGENLLSLSDPVWQGSGWLLSVNDLAHWITIVGWVVFMGGALWLSLRAYIQIQQPLHRNRITYWFAVTALVLADAILFVAGFSIPGGGFQTAGVLLATYVILIHSLIDVRQTNRWIIKYLIITVLTTAIYLAGILAIQRIFQMVPNYSTWLAGAVLAILLATVFDPLSKIAQRFVERLISDTRYDLRHTIQQYSAKISNILDLEELATMSLTFICNELDIRRSVLYVAHSADQENITLRGIIGTGDGLPPGNELPGGTLSAQSPVVLNMRELPALSQYDIDLLPRYEETSPLEKKWLTDLNMDIYVPIYASQEWIGLLTFGPKRSGDRYFEHDLALLRTLADQTAVALKNARLFDDLKHRNQRIEQLNYELSVANEKLSQLDQAKSDFIGVASHELRTPMTQIRGYSDMLLDMLGQNNLSPESGAMMIKGVSKGVNRLEEIVNKMFEISKIDTETLDLSVAPVSIKEVIDAVEQHFAAATQERQQTLSVENLADLPTIHADDERLKQVFIHLVQNAIKYTPDGGQISITGYCLDGTPEQPDEQFLEIVVADTGIGIATNELEHIFEKFYRVGDARHHSTGQTKFKGAGPGLGLTIARGIAGAHGGRIWSESDGYDEENCPGSKFYVMLPVNSKQLELIRAEAFEASL